MLNDISGAGGGKSGGEPAHTPVESPNTLRSTATARIVDLIGEGPIVGLVNGRKSVYFNDTPLDKTNGLPNFPDVLVETRVGLPDQAVLPDFAAVETEVNPPVNTTITHATPIVQTIAELDTDSARVTIRIPALWKANQQTGDVGPNSVRIVIQAKPAPAGYQTIFDATIQGKTVSDYEKSFLVRLSTLGVGPWDIKITRVSADYDSIAQAGEVVWSRLTKIINHRLIYPDSALIGVAADAQSFGGSNPTRSYLVDGLLIQVPSNYNTITRHYTGDWDGTFQTAFSNNPAWVFYALATNERFGLGEFLVASQLDKWALYTIAQYCDELVDNGQGGTEPRYTFNGVISDRDDAYRVLLSLASVFRGKVYWSSGAVFPTADMPSDPVKLVTPANVIGGNFSYQGASLKGRHSIVLVTWNDPANGYKPNIEVVEDRDAIDAYGSRFLEIAAVGCTSRGQARRYGKWVLETEAHESEIVTYTCSFDHADLLPGELIEIADPAYAGLRMGGRILEGATDSITIDDTVDITEVNDFSVDVVMPDGSIETSAVGNAAGETSVLNLTDDPLSQAPRPGAIWVLTSSQAAPRLFRVISITETDKHLFEISALFHSPGKYARVEGGLVVEDPDFTALPSGELAHPTNLTTQQYLYDAGAGVIYGAIIASWTGAADARVTRYEVEVARNGLDFARLGLSLTTSIDILSISRTESSVDVRVRGMDDLGRTSDWLTLSNISTTMFDARPNDVENFRIAIVGDTAHASWSPVRSLGFSHYVVRATPNLIAATWAGAAVLREEVVGSTLLIPATAGSYLIKAVSLTGVESLNAALTVVSGASLAPLNAVETFDPAPYWSGTLSNVEVIGGKLRLVAGQTEGLFTADGWIDLGDIFTSRVSAAPDVAGFNPSNVLSSWTSLASVTSLSGGDPSLWEIAIEESHTDDPTASPVVASDWAPLAVTDITARAYQIRVWLRSLGGGVTPRITALPVTIDMPDRLETIANETSGTTAAPGHRVDFDPPFHSLKEIITRPTLQSGDIEFIDPAFKSETGFNILYKNSVGTVVSRVFGFTAVGYGRKVS